MADDLLNSPLLPEVLQQYGVTAATATVCRLGNGLINDTLLVTTAARRFVLQRLNTRVFTRPQVLVDNARRVTDHLVAKQAAAEYSLSPVQQVPSEAGHYLVEDGEGGHWRALAYLGDNYSVEVIDSPALAREAGAAFGGFAAALADLDSRCLGVVIEDFHNLDLRLEAFDDALRRDPLNRSADCLEAIERVHRYRSMAHRLAQTLTALPQRVTHNDTKISNMLFHRSDDSAQAVIDLDTCMAGYLLFDFGDLVRGACSGQPEDGTDLSLVVVQEPIFAALAQGYLGGLGTAISPAERESLLLGVEVMTLMLAVRFLTDHLEGDHYFQVTREGHNLDRARNQLALLASVRAKASVLKGYLV